MERIGVKNGVGGFVLIKPDKNGPFVYAAQALHYQRSFHLSAACNVLLVVACMVLAGYLSYHKHDPVPVQTVSEEEYREVVQLAERKESEKAVLRKQLADERARRLLTDKMLQTSNANNAKLVQQLQEVQASVPPLPIIQEALRKEAATDAGFKAAVARGFGKDIAAHIQIKGGE